MNLSKIIGTLLIISSLGIGYVGVNKISKNTVQINLLGLKIDASNESEKQIGSIYLGFAAILFIGGIYTLNKSKNWVYRFISLLKQS